MLNKKNSPQEILSEIVIFQKYAKYLPEYNRRETWFELCDRNMQMHIKKYPQLKSEIEYAYKFVVNKQVLPSMRSMQFAGRPIELAANRIFNCAYAAVNDISIFSESIFLLLGGTGLGYSVQTHHVNQLPIVKGMSPKRRKFVIGDSIEGWSDSIKVLVKSYFLGKSEPVFDYSDIRNKGSRLITSGGKAPGADPLRICIDEMKKVFNGAIGRRLTPLECHDIICYIADAVLAGGIRRAALIALFDYNDLDMLSCKSGNWWELNPQRGRANNSAVLIRSEITEEQFKKVWERVELSGAGEPGIFWSNNRELGTNPCCIVGSSLIQTDRGVYSIKDLVDKLDNGEEFYLSAFNTETKELERKKIITGCLIKSYAYVINIKINSELELKCTPEHQIYTTNRGWVEAKTLTDIDTILHIVDENNTIEVTLTNNIHNYVSYLEDVYDIEIEDLHNFFANGILVKNCEISLNNMQFCNLCEVNVSDLESQEDFNQRVKIAAFLGTLQAGYTDFHYLRSEWQETTEKEALIGVGLTGIASGTVLGLNLKEAANVVKLENTRVAKLIGVNESARTTTLKPAGCLVPSTLIRTNKGLLTLDEIFKLNSTDIDTLGFTDSKEEISVYDENNELKPITKLFVNGVDEVIEIVLDDGYIINCTHNHKFLTKTGWKRAIDLLEDDDILNHIV